MIIGGQVGRPTARVGSKVPAITLGAVLDPNKFRQQALRVQRVPLTGGGRPAVLAEHAAEKTGNDHQSKCLRTKV